MTTVTSTLVRDQRALASKCPEESDMMWGWCLAHDKRTCDRLWEDYILDRQDFSNVLRRLRRERSSK